MMSDYVYAHPAPLVAGSETHPIQHACKSPQKLGAAEVCSTPVGPPTPGGCGP